MNKIHALQKAQSESHAKPLVCLTAYTAPMAQMLDPHCDILLVGDSVSMVLYGLDSTREATMTMMIEHGKAVMRSASKAAIVIDMPYGSYEKSPKQALKSAETIIKETGADAVKMEGDQSMAGHVALLTQHNIPVMGHVGLRPQSVTSPDGYRVQGKNDRSAENIIEDAKAIAKAGAFSLVLEAIPEALAAEITRIVDIPTIGIGASALCSGQILVTEDMLGLTLGHKPKFVKTYANLQETIERSIKKYAEDVRSRKFPEAKNTYTNIKKAS